MPSRNRKKRSKQRAEYLQKQDDILSQENKAKARARYKADPEKKKASVPDSYKADPEKKKASVRDNYKADPEKKKASVRDSYNADIESKQSAKRQRYQEDVEENRAAKRQKYEDNSAAIKASERNRYWNDPAVRLAKHAAERKRYRRGHRTTTITQRYVMACCIALALKSYRKMCMQHVYSTHVRDLHKTIHFTCTAPNCCVQYMYLCDLSIEYWGVILNLMYKKASLSLQLCMNLIAFATENYCNHILLPYSYSLYEPKSHALMEYNGGLEKAILRDSELLSEVNDAFCKSHPLLA